MRPLALSLEILLVLSRQLMAGIAEETQKEACGGEFQLRMVRAHRQLVPWRNVC